MKLRLWMGYRSWSLRRTCFQEDFVLLFVETIVTPLPLRCWRRTQSVRLCFTPRACIFRCNRRLLFVEKPLIPFFSIIILLLVTRLHTKTRHRVTLNGTAHWALWISVCCVCFVFLPWMCKDWIPRHSYFWFSYIYPLVSQPPESLGLRLLCKTAPFLPVIAFLIALPNTNIFRFWKWWKLEGWEDFYFPFWGLNWPENSSSFPPPWGRGRHVRSERGGVSLISIENLHTFSLPMSHTKKKNVPFLQKRPEKTTSSHQGLSSNYDFLQSSYSNSFQHSMTPQRRKWHGRDARRNLTDSSLFGEKSVGLLFQLQVFCCCLVKKLFVFFCWRVLILVFSGQQVGKAYDSGWILECWTYHSV